VAARGLRVGLVEAGSLRSEPGSFVGDVPGGYAWDSRTGHLFEGDGVPADSGLPAWNETCVVGCGLLPGAILPATATAAAMPCPALPCPALSCSACR
jgi:hypothetical protein